MEPSYQTRKIIGQVLAVCAVALVAGAGWLYTTRPFFRILTTRQDVPVRIVFFTKPAMRFAYNPHTRKSVVTLASAACQPAQKEKCFNGEFDLFYIPQEVTQTDFWHQFKTFLSSWRNQPGRLLTALHAYINALVQHRTDITPAHLAVLGLDLTELTAADFAIEQPVQTTKKKQKTPQPAPAPKVTPSLDQPLKVIILNASGKKGLAESLKQYLRAQHAKGVLQVDVYDTGNYPTPQETSFIEDYSGRLTQVTQVSHAIGIRSEIRSAVPTSDAYYDSRIVLGKDFKMPL